MGNFLECHPNKKEVPPKKPEEPPNKPAIVSSEQVIQEFIEVLMKDPKINKKAIPDKIEKEFYLVLFTTLMSNLMKIADTFKIEIMNHVITLKIEPKKAD